MRTVAHSSACWFRSSRLWKLRPGRKLVSTVQKLLSSPAFRLGWRIAWQRNSEAVALGEGGHFRRDHRLLAAAAQPRQVGVVDHALPGGVAPEHQRLVQETLHSEAVERAVELQVPPLRVPQVQQAGNDPRRPARQFHLVNRGVVLHLQPGSSGTWSQRALAGLPSSNSRTRRVKVG